MDSQKLTAAGWKYCRERGFMQRRVVEDVDLSLSNLHKATGGRFELVHIAGQVVGEWSTTPWHRPSVRHVDHLF